MDERIFIFDLLGRAKHYCEYLTTTKSKNEVKSRLLLNVVVTKGSTILKLLTSKDKSLLIRRNTLLVLNLSLDVIDGIGGLNIESNSLTS